MASNAYSFADVLVAIKGPNGSFNLGVGAAPAEEGISISQVDDKNTMMIGADGFAMHSLHMSKGGAVTVRLLKTSPTNALLMDMYNSDSSSASLWGQNTILIRDAARGDEITCAGCAFKKVPDVSFGKDGNVYEWTWDAATIDYVLGTGTPSIVL